MRCRINHAMGVAMTLVAAMSMSGCGAAGSGSGAGEESTGSVDGKGSTDSKGSVESKGSVGSVEGSGAATYQNLDLPEPVASVSVGEEHSINFYQLHGGVNFVTETGPASGQAVLPVMKKQLGLDQHSWVASDLFHALRPDLPIPDALVDMKFGGSLASQAAAGPNNVRSAKPISLGGHDGPQGTAPADGVGQVSAALNACNNGCCDGTWLLGSGPCNYFARGPDWFYFDYGWSGEHGSCGSFICEDEIYDVVCAGSGTSAVTFSYCANGCVTYHNSVPEAHYITYDYYLTADVWLGTSFSVQANSSSSPHLHTQCGDWG